MQYLDLIPLICLAYDFHGAWDKDVDEEDGTAKPHTSSLDIMDAINLYTRAEVDLSKGMRFHFDGQNSV